MPGLPKAYPRPALTDNTNPPVFEHEGKRLPFFQLTDGRWVCKARDLGRMLGYGNDGRSLVQLVKREWADEFEDGTELLTAKPSDLRGVVSDTTLNRRGETLLTREGVNAACLKTDKPLGKVIRRWLSRDAMIQIQDTGRYESPGLPQPAPTSAVDLFEDLIARALDAKVTAACLAELTAERAKASIGLAFTIPKLAFETAALPAPAYQTSIAFDAAQGVSRHMVGVVMAPAVLKKLRQGDATTKAFIRAAVNDCIDHPERGVSTLH